MGKKGIFKGTSCIIIITHYSGLCSCTATAIQVYFRQSFRGSISIKVQCIETQLMPNEGPGKDLQIIAGHCTSLFFFMA